MPQAAYHGPYLSWSGKKAPGARAGRPTSPEARYAPAPNYDARRRRAAGPALRRAGDRPARSPAMARRRPRRSLSRRHSRRRRPPKPIRPPPPMRRRRPAAAPPVACARRCAAAGDRAGARRGRRLRRSPAAPLRRPRRPRGPASVRFYSLHREYGMTPDPIPQPTEDHTVLIGPPDQRSAAARPGRRPGPGRRGQDDGKPAAHGEAPATGRAGTTDAPCRSSAT